MSRLEDKTITKHEWVLEGLDCANCANKIEHGVGKVKGISSSSVNFVTKTLKMEVNRSDRITEDQVLDEVRKQINRLEPQIIVIDKNSSHDHNLDHEHNDQVHRQQAHYQQAHYQKAHYQKAHYQQVHHQKAHHQQAHHQHDAHEGHAQGQHQAHTHSHNHSHAWNMRLMYRLMIGAALMLMALLVPFAEVIAICIYIAAYAVVGGDIVWRALKNVARRQWFDEYFLMTIATLGAFAIAEYPEAVGVMLFYQVGELFQGYAVNRSRKSISDLLDIRPDYANVKRGQELYKVSPEQVEIGDLIVIKPGEKVPLDGQVIEGSSFIDTSALTGESIPREVEAGSEVLSGFVNQSGLLTVKATKSYNESTVSKILDLVQNASGKKSPTESFITKFARFYTPAVVFIAIALAVLPPLLFAGEVFSEWLYRALIFLVISCPCALVVSIPLGFFGGIGAASRNGILIKGGNYLEALNAVKYAVFDKTGTLTKGSFTVTGIYPVNGLSEQELLTYAAYAEQHSTHPIAVSILAAYNAPIQHEQIEAYEDIAGHGIAMRWNGKSILVGNRKLMEREGIPYKAQTHNGTIVYVAIDGQFGGYLLIADEVKEDAKDAISTLKELGVKKTIMLTGDSAAVGEAVGNQLGLDEIYTELLPQHKVEHIERIAEVKSSKEKIAFIGDGINDTPVLAQADVGIAMGGLGSDAAIEAADIVIMTDEPSKLATAIQIARRTRRIVWQNIAFALGVKAIFLILGAFGIATMWEAVFSDVGVTLLAVLNAMRVLRVKQQELSM